MKPPKPLTPTELASLGAILLRHHLAEGRLAGQPVSEKNALTALCDYVERTVAARASGGRSAGAKTGAENGKKRKSRNRH